MNKAPKLVDQITSDLIAQDGLSPFVAGRVAMILVKDHLTFEEKQEKIDWILANLE